MGILDVSDRRRGRVGGRAGRNAPARTAGAAAVARERASPVVFREDWKLDPNASNVNNEREPEHPIVQGDVANPDLAESQHGDGHRSARRLLGAFLVAVQPHFQRTSISWICVSAQLVAGPTNPGTHQCNAAVHP